MRKGNFRGRNGPQRLRSISPAFQAAITPKPSLGDADEWLDVRTKRAAKTLAEHRANMAKWVQGDTMVWGRDEDLPTLRDFALELKAEVEAGDTAVAEKPTIRLVLPPVEFKRTETVRRLEEQLAYEHASKHPIKPKWLDWAGKVLNLVFMRGRR